MLQIPESVLIWIAAGEHGMSSEAMILQIWGAPVAHSYGPHGRSHPLDPDDFKRCLKLLAVSPETKERLHVMRGVSFEWRNLVDNWGTLEKMFLEEAGDIDWSSRKPASKTYRAMQACFTNTSGAVKSE